MMQRQIGWVGGFATAALRRREKIRTFIWWLDLAGSGPAALSVRKVTADIFVPGAAQAIYNRSCTPWE